MAFERRLMVMFRPSSSRRTFSSRVPNKVSMLGVTPMFFFILYVLSGGPPQASTEEPNRARNPANAEHTSTGLQTKHSFAWRRDRSNCACPEGKSLPLTKAYPGDSGCVNGRKTRQVF